MVKHIVMWKFKEIAEGASGAENAAKVKGMLEALAPKIKGILKFEIGKNFTPGGYDLCIYSEFVDTSALEGYQIHPEHQIVRNFVKLVTSERAAADYQI